MKLALLRVGPVDENLIRSIRSGLCKIFPETTCLILEDVMPMPKDAYDMARRQCYSSNILAKIEAEEYDADRVLAVTEADLYVPRLNFVFGEALCPGKAAVISLCRLRPEFYGESPNRALFVERSVKEAVHEVGHTFGLGHCHNSACVMFFSNSILDTDRKKLVFCERCGGLLEKSLRQIRSVQPC